MTWSDFYLFCFIVGFALSLASFVAGAVNLHLPFHLHTDIHGVHHDGAFVKGALPAAHGHAASGTANHGSSASDGHVSWLNASTAMAFLAWFGGTGYILTRASHLVAVASLGIAALSGTAAAWLVFRFMAKLTGGNDSQLHDADYRLEGSVGTISIPIRQHGTGEVIFSLGGVRRSFGARCDDGAAIEKGTEVVIERYDKGIAYVRRWDEFTR
jgi:membrane protein implicated in regulation of membrane protease activity